MLILTRRAGEALIIGDDIEVTVMAVNGSQVRLGVKAPADVSVDRQEVRERKIEEQRPQGHGRGCECRFCQTHISSRAI